MRKATLTNAFTKGVLDPALAERIDLAHYYQGVRTGNNVEFAPQGGFRRRAGSDLSSLRRLRRKIEPIQVTAPMVTAVNGGTAASLVDQDPATLFTTAAVSGTPFVLFELDLGAPGRLVTFVDLVAFRCQTAATYVSDGVLAIEYWTGAAWNSLGAFEGGAIQRRDIRTQARTRRFGFPPGLAVTTRYVRAVIYGAPAIGTVSIGGVRLWAERTDLSPVRGLAFSKSTSATYQMVLSDRNIDVYDGQAFLGAISTPYGADIVREVNFEQSLDTLFLFHEDIATRQVVRQGRPDEWNIDKCAFTNVPVLTAAAAFGGASNEKQSIELPGLALGQTIVLLMDDQMTAPVTYATTVAQLAADLAVAIKAIPGVNVTDLFPTSATTPVPTVIFEWNQSNGNRAWPRLQAIVLGVASSPLTRILQAGLNPSGGFFSDTTGWPRCGALNQARLFLGGFRGAPQTVIASVLSSPLSYLTGTTADKAIIMTFDTDQVETIQELYVGRHMQAFTDRGMWWSDNRSFSATSPVNWILANRDGIKPNTPAIFGDNATMYVNAGGDDDNPEILPGTTLYATVYSNDTQNYENTIQSLLAPHLITNAEALAYRSGKNASDGGQTYVVNADGSAAVLSLLKSQEVVAWSRWTTDGQYRDVFVDPRFRVFFIVERAGQLWLERRNARRYTDASITKTGAANVIVGGLDIHDGKQVWCFADRGLAGPHVPAAGTITLGTAAIEVISGLDFPVDIEPMPLREKLNQQMPFRPPARIYEAEISVMASGPFSFAVGDDADGAELEPGFTDGGPEPIEATGEELLGGDDDAPLLDRLHTGMVLLEQIEGWWQHPRWTIRQRKPAPLYVRAVRLELNMKG